MKKVVILILLCVLLSACETTDYADEGEVGPTECPYDCSSGDDGVSTTITNPSDEGTVYINDRMEIRVKVQDKGESSASGVVCLTGLDPEEFNGVSECDCESFYIDLDEEDALDYESITFDSALVTEDAAGDHDLTAITRYDYTTYGIFEVCLTGDPDNEEDCDTSTTKNRLSVSSSGPLNVDSITQSLNTVGDDITLRLSVEVEIDTSVTESLIDADDAMNEECELSMSDYTIPVDVDLVLFEELYENACGQMQFEEGEDTATVSCKVDVRGDQLSSFGSKKEWEGYISFDYGIQSIESIGFEAISE